MISLIATVLNEGESVRQLLDSIAAQSLQPDEVVIVDGGSADDTVAIIEGYGDTLPLRVLTAPGSNISQGRNRAISAAKGDIIAVTDAGVRLSETWLERVTGPLLADAELVAVAGFFRADPQTAFEAALGATTLPLAEEIDTRRFLPSSRSAAFRKWAALAIDGYPEWLDYGEDLVFDLRLRAMAGSFTFQPGALVYFRPRSSMRAFYRQYYLYARGDGKANLWFRRHVIRYGVYLLLIPLILLLGAGVHPLWWGLVPLGAAVYLWRPYRRLRTVLGGWSGANWVTWLYCVVMAPVIRVVGDIAKMHGYPCGWYWRWRNRPPDWRDT